MSREEKFRRKGKAKIKNLKPKDYEDGYYVDEFGEKQKQEKRAKEIRAQEREVIRRRKKSLTSTQIKHRRIALYSSIFAAVLIIGVILSLTVLFKTEKIEVVGDKYYDEKRKSSKKPDKRKNQNRPHNDNKGRESGRRKKKGNKPFYKDVAKKRK